MGLSWRALPSPPVRISQTTLFPVETKTVTSDHSPDIEVDYRQWSGFFQELGTESDRGATILASVWIENLLERKLRSLFKEGSSAARRKLFELNGPFSSFSSKILAAYSLGWINSDAFHDINLIRKIRNQFAHDLHGLDLESAKNAEAHRRI